MQFHLIWPINNIQMFSHCIDHWLVFNLPSIHRWTWLIRIGGNFVGTRNISSSLPITLPLYLSLASEPRLRNLIKNSHRRCVAIIVMNNDDDSMTKPKPFIFLENCSRVKLIYKENHPRQCMTQVMLSCVDWTNNTQRIIENNCDSFPNVMKSANGFQSSSSNVINRLTETKIIFFFSLLASCDLSFGSLGFDLREQPNRIDGNWKDWNA